MQDPDSAAVADRQHAACRAGGLQLTRLDSQHQPLPVINLHIKDVHVGNIEDRIGPGALKSEEPVWVGYEPFERSFIHACRTTSPRGGWTQGITDDAAPSSHPLQMQSIFGELDAAGKSWKAYQEGMTSNCMTPNTGRYAVKHDRGAYYVPLLSACQINDVRMGTTTSGNFVNHINNGTLPNCSFVTPDTCN
jgi:hypothetical protein